MEYTDGVKAELKDKGAKKVFSLSGLRLYECPLSYITEETAALARLCYLMDDSKRLLFGDGWGGQPFWLVEAYEVYKGELFRHYNNLNKL